jgi:hypothetical protein
MEYTYFLEKLANQNISIDKLYSDKLYSDKLYSDKLYKESQTNIVYILCYHVINTAKYPFLQFMMEKIPYCNNLIKEKFTLPFIMYNDKSITLQQLGLDKVRNSLYSICCDGNKVTDSMYKGIFYDTSENPYIVIDITGIDIYGLNLSRNTLTWFILPSEIVNTKKICNIEVDDEVTQLFTEIPELCLLTNPKTDATFIIPDAVYTGGEHKQVEFNSIFKNNKTKEYDTCGEYYYFYKTFGNAVKEGGWIKSGGTNKIDINSSDILTNSSGRLIVENANEYGMYINGGINRFALFIEGQIYIEKQLSLQLSDECINTLYPEPSIIICYSNSNVIKRDLLVKEYKNFASLSYHKLNKQLLDDRYIDENNHNYMIM